MPATNTMIIEIKQDLTSLLGDNYAIFTDGKRTMSAFSILRDGFSILQLQKFPSDQIILTIESLVGFFGPKYIIERGNNAYYFRTITWYRGHYQCLFGDDVYDVYAHDELRYSVYCNNEMVGYWEGAAITFGEGDKYKITMNADANKNLLIAFCLIIDRHYHNEGGLLKINIGRLLPETKIFDVNWTPKN